MSEATLIAMAGACCLQLKHFCSALHSSTMQLRSAVSQKPSMSADLTSFLEGAKERVSSAAAEVESLTSMTVDAIPLRELLAHCMELYKQNEASIAPLESQLEQFGYIKDEIETPRCTFQALEHTLRGTCKSLARDRGSRNTSSLEIRIPPETRSRLSAMLNFEAALPTTHLASPLPSALASSKLDHDHMSLLGEFVTPEDFGLSASSLASITRIDPCSPGRAESLGHSDHRSGKAEAPDRSDHHSETTCEPSNGSNAPLVNDQSTSGDGPIVLVGQEEYEKVSPWLRQRVTLEELNEAVGKISTTLLAK